MNLVLKCLSIENPECVRCSVCVQSYPIGVPTFGRIDRKTGTVLHTGYDYGVYMSPEIFPENVLTVSKSSFTLT